MDYFIIFESVRYDLIVIYVCAYQLYIICGCVMNMSYIIIMYSCCDNLKMTLFESLCNTNPSAERLSKSVVCK